jgi:putative Mn2+ efflux pump MntP
MLSFIQTINEWISVIPLIVMGASLICSITPTPKDDVWIGKVYKILDWCALNIGKAKEK